MNGCGAGSSAVHLLPRLCRRFRSDAALEAIARARDERVPNLALYNYPSFSGAFSALFARLFHSRLRVPCLVLPFSSVEPFRWFSSSFFWVFFCLWNGRFGFSVYLGSCDVLELKCYWEFWGWRASKEWSRWIQMLFGFWLMLYYALWWNGLCVIFPRTKPKECAPACNKSWTSWRVNDYVVTNRIFYWLGHSKKFPCIPCHSIHSWQPGGLIVSLLQSWGFANHRTGKMLSSWLSWPKRICSEACTAIFLQVIWHRVYY